LENQITKRQTYIDDFGNCPIFPNFDISQDNLIQLQKILSQCINIYLYFVAQFFEEWCTSCLSNTASNCELPDISQSQSCAYDLVCIFQKPKLIFTTQVECSSYSAQLNKALINDNDQRFDNSTTTTTTTTTESFMNVIPAAAGTIGGIGAITFLIQAPTTLVTPQGIPSGNPLPGTPGIPVL
jgi:hypothetical protein